MIIESISIKPKAISTFMPLEEFIECQNQRSRRFYGSGKARKGIVTYFLITIIHIITEAESLQKYIGENCLLD